MKKPIYAIDAIGLKKIYNRNNEKVVALNHFDLAIAQGSFFGLLGPNGAGKSTFINILAGLVNKTSGSARIWGYDLDSQTRNARVSIGVVPQELVLDPYFTARETLEVQAGYFGLRKSERRTDEILDAVGLTNEAETYPRALSGGMRRRLMVGKALVHSPPIIVLDEPTAGVDVELRQQLWSYLRKLNDHGTSVVLTTHYLEEAESLCDTIAIIDKGKLIACEPTETLIKRIDVKEIIISTSDDVKKLPTMLDVFEIQLINPRKLIIRYRRESTQIDKLLSEIRNAGIKISDITTNEPDLEDIFLQLTSLGRNSTTHNTNNSTSKRRDLNNITE